MSMEDFNDLSVLLGDESVLMQFSGLMKTINNPEVFSCGESPAPPFMGEAQEITFEGALKRFALIFATTDVWDSHESVRLKRMPFQALVGKEVYKEWMDCKNKRQVKDEDVRAAIASAQAAASTKGSGDIAEALQRFTYLEPSNTVWDHHLREIVRMEDLKYVMPDSIDIWLRHPDRRKILKRNLVFDPAQLKDPSTHINMFKGLPLKPTYDWDRCHAIRAMLFYLCNQDADVWNWLSRWLAYPLQHVGAKMATAVLMHSEVQGSGKSMLFDGVMRPIYGEYGATLGQHQLEGQYTDWRSGLLYGLFEEIFSRDQKYSHTGTLKQMITGDKFRIEKKFMSGWEEDNYMNCIFLSNEIQPFPVDPSDRRFLVVWPNWKLPEDLQAAVSEELKNGGVEAFYGWLLNIELDGFYPHTKPPMTEAKKRLIDFGRANWEVFLMDWESGVLAAPYMTCRVSQLFRLYEKWCAECREHVLGRNKFADLVGRRITHKKNVKYMVGLSTKQQAFFIVGDKPENKTQEVWLGECCKTFEEYLGTENDQ